MIYINDKFIEMYAEMTKKFYDSINEENEKQKDMIEFINYLKELIERNHSLEKENQQLKEQLEQKENEIKELCKKLKVKEKSRRKMQKSLMDKVQKSERARKEAIELVKNNQRKDEFVELNEWQARDLISILDIDKGE